MVLKAHQQPEAVRRDPRPGAARGSHTRLTAKIQEHIRTALERLPAQQKSVFILRFYQDMPLKEIGKVLKLSEGTVKSHLFRTVRKLREYLKMYEADFEVE